MDGKLQSDFTRDSSRRAERTCRNTLRKPEITVSKRATPYIIRERAFINIFLRQRHKIGTDHVVYYAETGFVRGARAKTRETRKNENEGRFVFTGSTFTYPS